MQYSWRFQLALILTAVISAFAVITAEYSYEASSATVNIFLSLILTFSALYGFSRPRRKLHWVGRVVLHTITVLCVFGFLWHLLGSKGGPMLRAFGIAHLTIVLMSCKFILAYRTRDYAQIFILTILLIVVAAITCTNIALVPIYIVYMVLSSYALIIYHLQRQVELVTATRFIGWTPDAEGLERIRQETGGFWFDLGHGRFNVTCISMLVLGLIFAGVVFLMFPRFETGSLLGSRFGVRVQSGFTDQIQLGYIDRSETLRQVVARVSITRNKELIGSRNNPYYLRCSILDQYWQSRIDDKSLDVTPALWTRSFLNYLLQESQVEPDYETPVAPLLEQDYLLSDWSTPYLPTVYPIQTLRSSEGQLKLRMGRLDRVICSMENRQGSFHYIGQSLSPVSSRQAYVWFKKQVEILGRYWLAYGNNYILDVPNSMIGYSNTFDDLAKTIVGPLKEQRSELLYDRQKAYFQWSAYRDSKNFAFQNVKTMWDVYKLSKEEDPNIVRDLKYYELFQDVYDQSVKLAQVDREIAEDVVQYLREHYKYAIDSEIPLYPEDLEVYSKDNPYYDPVSEFISRPGVAGNCEMFASAMVLLCRSMGLQSRLAVGYLAHDYVPEFGYYLVRQSDAHSWVEVYTADQDWVAYDPTPALPPPDKTPPSALSAFLERVNHYFENIQYRWLKFSISGQGRDALVWATLATSWLEGLENSAQTLSDSKTANMLRGWFTHQSEESYFALFVRWMIFFCFIINVFIGFRELLVWVIPQYTRHRVHKRNLAIYQGETVRFYRQMLEILHKIHIYKAPHLTPREFAFRLIAYDSALSPVGKLSELYYRIRFGQLSIDDKHQQMIDQALGQLHIFTQSVRKTIRRPWPWELED